MGNWDDFETPENDGPNYWNPTEPESVEGVIVDIGSHKDEDEKVHPQLTLDVDGATVVVTGFRKLLRDALLLLVKEEGAKEGDRVKIDFKGKAAGKRYFLYEAKLVGAKASRDAKDNEEF